MQKRRNSTKRWKGNAPILNHENYRLQNSLKIFVDYYNPDFLAGDDILKKYK